MTFDKAKASFRVSKNYKTACAYLAAASQGKAAIEPHELFNSVGEVANWLSTPMNNCSALMPPTRNGNDESSEGEDDAWRYMPNWIKEDRTEFVLEIVSALGLAFVALRWLQLA